MLVAAEVAASRALSAPPRTDLDEQLTLVVKTFERPATLRRLVTSIRRLYPTVRVIVVDDSRVPSQLPGVDTIALPYDQGVSIGRQAGLDQVLLARPTLLAT